MNTFKTEYDRACKRLAATGSTWRVIPAPILPVTDTTNVTHRGPNHELFFGEIEAFVEPDLFAVWT